MRMWFEFEIEVDDVNLACACPNYMYLKNRNPAKPLASKRVEQKHKDLAKYKQSNFFSLQSFNTLARSVCVSSGCVHPRTPLQIAGATSLMICEFVQ